MQVALTTHLQLTVWTVVPNGRYRMELRVNDDNLRLDCNTSEQSSLEKAI